MTFYGLEKEMTTHSSVLAWRIPGTGEPGGLPSWRDSKHECAPPTTKKVPTAHHPLPISMEDLQELEHTQPAQANVNLVPHKTNSEVTPPSSWHPEHTWESPQRPAAPPPGKQTNLPT